jgi:hypothetical protein
MLNQYRVTMIFNVVMVTLITITGLILRLDNLEQWWLNPDEGIYFAIATQKSFAHVIAATIMHAHPPLYYVLLWLAARITTEFQNLRLLSVLFGTLTIPLTFYLSRLVTTLALHKKNEPLNNILHTLLPLSLTLGVAMTPASIILAGVLRPYALLVFLTTLTIIYGLKSNNENAKKYDQLIYQICLSLTILTHYSGALIMIIMARLWPTISKWFKTHLEVLIVLLFVVGINLQFVIKKPVIWNFKKSYLDDQYFTSLTDLVKLPLELLAFNGTPFFALPLLVISILAFIVSASKHKDTPAVLSFSSFTIPLTFALLGLYPYGGSRHTYYLLPFIVTSISYIITYATTSALIAFIIAATLFPYSNQFISLKHQPSEERTLAIADLDKITKQLQSLDWQKSNIVIDEQTRFTLGPWIKYTFNNIVPEGRAFFTPDHWILGLAEPIETEIPKRLKTILNAFHEKWHNEAWYVLTSGWNLKDIKPALPPGDSTIFLVQVATSPEINNIALQHTID